MINDNMTKLPAKYIAEVAVNTWLLNKPLKLDEIKDILLSTGTEQSNGTIVLDPRKIYSNIFKDVVKNEQAAQNNGVERKTPKMTAMSYKNNLKVIDIPVEMKDASSIIEGIVWAIAHNKNLDKMGLSSKKNDFLFVPEKLASDFENPFVKEAVEKAEKFGITVILDGKMTIQKKTAF